MYSPDPASLNRVPPASGRQIVALIGASWLAFGVLVAVFWVGFLGSDDALYWGGASGWLRSVPYIGTSHWTLRHTLVIPLALARLVFGNGMTAMVAPVILYALATQAVIAAWIGRVAGVRVAAVALLLVVSNPQFILLSSSAYIDLVEIFYLVSGLALFHTAVRRGGDLRLLLAAGIVLGFGVLSRETSAFAAAGIGVLFVLGFGMSRWRYFVLGFGCAVPVGLEFLWLWQSTGVLFYRSNIVAHHDSTIDRWLPQGAAVPLVHPAIDPFIMLLLNHNFALLFWVGVPVAIWLARRRGLAGADRQLVTLLGVVALTWTLIAAFMWRLLPLTPRYFLLPSVLVAIVAGLGVVRLWENGFRRLCLWGLAAVVAVNGLALSLDNRHYMWGEHTLVALARGLPSDTIHTSGSTLRRAQLLLEWDGSVSRILPTPPAPGDLYYFDPTRGEGGQQPGPGWTVVRTLAPDENLGQWLLAHLVGRDRIPAGIWSKLGPGHPPVTLYRVG